MKSASGFLHKLQNDKYFVKRAKACKDDEERRAFLVDEQFDFTPEELDAAVKCLSLVDKSEETKDSSDLRKTERYDVFLNISELDGKPVDQAIMLDISAWGAKIESQIPLKPDSTVEFSIALAGNGGRSKRKYRLTGKVLWVSRLPISKHSQAGVQFHSSLEEMHNDGKFSLENLNTTIKDRQNDISNKEFLSIREFADTIGVHWFTVWRWTVERRIHFKQVKSGCKILIPRAELLQFQAQP